MRTFHYYMDDSGTRHPDHANGSIVVGQPDWFGLGGVIVEDRDEDELRGQIDKFKSSWGVTAPLHSHPIRRRKDDFAWLNGDAAMALQFQNELSGLLVGAKVIGHGCVIDRPSYNLRYRAQYGRNPWSLCKTTFNIAVERAAKYAISHGGRLRVYAERSSRKDERMLNEYYDGLRASGNPFDANRSAGYSPLEQNMLREALFEFRPKNKSSPIMQLADLYLYPICRGGYDKLYRPYVTLCENRKLVDQHIAPESILQLGIKYSCFDQYPHVLKCA
jgi:hypothetical protein